MLICPPLRETGSLGECRKIRCKEHTCFDLPEVLKPQQLIKTSQLWKMENELAAPFSCSVTTHHTRYVHYAVSGAGPRQAMLTVCVSRGSLNLRQGEVLHHLLLHVFRHFLGVAHFRDQLLLPRPIDAHQSRCVVVRRPTTRMDGP